MCVGRGGRNRTCPRDRLVSVIRSLGFKQEHPGGLTQSTEPPKDPALKWTPEAERGGDRGPRGITQEPSKSGGQPQPPTARGPETRQPEELGTQTGRGRHLGSQEQPARPAQAAEQQRGMQDAQVHVERALSP